MSLSLIKQGQLWPHSEEWAVKVPHFTHLMKISSLSFILEPSGAELAHVVKNEIVKVSKQQHF